MSVLLVITIGVIIGLALLGLGLWLTWFVMSLDVEVKSPIDAITDHAESTAYLVNEFLERKRGK